MWRLRENAKYSRDCETPTLLRIQGFAGSFRHASRATFLDACKFGTKAPVPTDQILYNQLILDYIKKSADAGRELAVELPEI